MGQGASMPCEYSAWRRYGRGGGYGHGVAPEIAIAMGGVGNGSSAAAGVDIERALLWEVHIARNCLESFTKIIDAHAIVLSLLVTVNLVAFLQPPKGWELIPNADGSTSRSVMYASHSMDSFAICNSLSLFSAISGLMLYVYCSYSTIMTFASVGIPDRLDALGLRWVRKLRSALRLVALPALKRRSIFLFAFLVTSLSFCVAAYISAGVAAVRPGRRLLLVVAPSLPGCAVVLLLLALACAKMALELDFDRRFRLLWDVENLQQPELDPCDHNLVDALDPVPSVVRAALKLFCCCLYRDRPQQQLLGDSTHRSHHRSLP